MVSFNMLQLSTTLFIVFQAAGSVMAICKSGQMGVGTFSSGIVTRGVLLANNCGTISESSSVSGSGFQDPSQPPCIGGYGNGASVTCNDDGVAVSAVDTQGNHWNCGKNTGGRCSIALEVLACCDRA